MRTIRSVDWAILGSIINCALMVYAFYIFDFFFFGLTLGFWFGGLYWTYWVQYHNKEGAK